MLMVRFLLSDGYRGCLAKHVYSPAVCAVTLFRVSVEEGRIQSLP